MNCKAITRIVLTGMVLCALGLASVRPATAEVQQGERAPAFKLADQTGKAHTLSSYHGKWVVLAFYPADMSPGCTLEARSFRDAQRQITKLNAVTLGISVQDTASHAKFCKEENLNYTLLADSNKKVAKEYGVLGGNGNARRVTFIINPKGFLAKRIDKVNVRAHGEDVMALLKQLEKPADPPAYIPRTQGIHTLKPGVRAPLFSLPSVTSSGKAALSDLLHHKGVVVVWVSVHCPVSNSYQQRMAELAREYAPRGIAFVGINSNANESKEAASEHFRQAGLGFPVLKDVDDVVANEYGAMVTPEVFLIDANGVIRYHGGIDDSQNPEGVKDHLLANALNEYLAGQPIKHADTRAFGCSIKRPRKS